MRTQEKGQQAQFENFNLNFKATKFVEQACATYSTTNSSLLRALLLADTRNTINHIIAVTAAALVTWQPQRNSCSSGSSGSSTYLTALSLRVFLLPLVDLCITPHSSLSSSSSRSSTVLPLYWPCSASLCVYVHVQQWHVTEQLQRIQLQSDDNHWRQACMRCCDN
jgi:hypothetical protein